MMLPSIIFESSNTLFSINSDKIVSIIYLPNVTQVPTSDSRIRGIINFRDEIFTVIDFRKLISRTSVSEELQNFILMLEEREKDHLYWLQTLENSVIENKPFTLTTDPHKCKFGIWYDNFKTSNMAIRKILKQFDQPHKNIHDLAFKIEKCKSENQLGKCKDIIERSRNKEFKLLVSLFAKLKQNASLVFQESALLMNLNAKKIALVVDKIISVENIESIDTSNLENNSLISFKENFITGIGQSKDKKLVQTVSELMLV